MEELKKCPITRQTCQKSDCMWWCEFANDCSVSLLATMFADSEICRNIFE